MAFGLRAANKRGAWLLCWALTLLAATAPMPAQAFVSKPECKSLFELTPLADESKLSVDDRAALARLRELAASDNQKTGSANPLPPTIYNFNSLFIAINPGVGKAEEFGARGLIVATSIEGTIHSIVHPIRSPRYEFGFTVSSMIARTFLTFYGDAQLQILATAPLVPKSGEVAISFEVIPASTDAPCGG
jgi:hypothetical protein